MLGPRKATSNVFLFVLMLCPSCQHDQRVSWMVGNPCQRGSQGVNRGSTGDEVGLNWGLSEGYQTTYLTSRSPKWAQWRRPQSGLDPEGGFLGSGEVEVLVDTNAKKAYEANYWKGPSEKRKPPQLSPPPPRLK